MKAVKTRGAPAARAARISVKRKTLVTVPFYINISLKINVLFIHTHIPLSEYIAPTSCDLCNLYHTTVNIRAGYQP